VAASELPLAQIRVEPLQIDAQDIADLQIPLGVSREAFTRE